MALQIITPGVVLRVFGKRAQVVSREIVPGKPPNFWLKALEDTCIRTVALRAGGVFRVRACTVYISPKISIPMKKKSSIYKGVCWLPHINRWLAYAKKPGQVGHWHLGLFINEHDAGRAVQRRQKSQALRKPMREELELEGVKSNALAS